MRIVPQPFRQRLRLVLFGNGQVTKCNELHTFTVTPQR
jgi:hypothetical protein